jgi:hypothetical protein
MKRNQDELGRFTSKFENLGDTIVMRIPRSLQKPIKALLKELNSIDPDISDPEEILWEIIEIIEQKAKNCI